jgi:hypothetical protein
MEKGNEYAMERTMHEWHINVLIQRLGRLERAQHRWQVLGTLALMVLGLVGLTAATRGRDAQVTEEIRAQAFVLVNQEGTVLARLGLLPQGGLGLGVYDRGRKSRLLLTAEADGSSALRLFGKNGKGSVLLAVGANGAPSLRLLDQRWRVRASLATWPDGSPFLQLTDNEGQDRVILGYTELVVLPTGTIEKRPASSLTFFDRGGTVIWRVP